ncbi:MAG: hypothetical protein ABFS35_17810 [Bacteroidota bacterium]
MVLGIAEDFTSDVLLDTQLKSSTSGLYLNSGVHPSITIDNLLNFLPIINVTTKAWDSTKTYGEYVRDKADLVTYNNKLYQSIKSANLNQNPTTETAYWLETNLSSLRLKNLIQQVKDKVYSDLNLTVRLINNQALYEIGDKVKALPNDYAAWVFEPKGSDYTSFRINQISFQKESTTPVNLYVINQGVLIDTLTITPSNGIFEFKDLEYTFSGKGKWIFAIDSTDVLVSGKSIDSLKYDGFVVYTATGIGATPESADYSYGTMGNGLGFNITTYLDSSLYISNNVNEFSNFIRATFEYVVFQMFLHNPNNMSNLNVLIQMEKDIVLQELKNIQANTVAKRYEDEKRKAIKQLQKTFDTQLDDNEYEIEITTV